jgi:hypothetical protein
MTYMCKLKKNVMHEKCNLLRDHIYFAMADQTDLKVYCAVRKVVRHNAGARGGGSL